ncbi:hypothetical protein BK026_06360 [Alteromonas sp. V450]|nr:hypothetical protein BK026_06360 [Alteromonas sp. V450]
MVGSSEKRLQITPNWSSQLGFFICSIHIFVKFNYYSVIKLRKTITGSVIMFTAPHLLIFYNERNSDGII